MTPVKNDSSGVVPSGVPAGELVEEEERDGRQLDALGELCLEEELEAVVILPK